MPHSDYRPDRRLPPVCRGPMPIVDDGDTDDRWASAVLLAYFGLLLVVGVTTLYAFL